MDKEHYEEWGRLRESAGRALRQGEWGVRLGMFPSFGDAWVIGIVPVVRRVPDRLRERGYDVHARRWRYGVDIAKFASPIERMKHPLPRIPPTIEARTAALEQEFVSSLLAQLDALCISAFPSAYPVAIDGVSYEVDFNVSPGFCRAGFQWSCEGPAGWKALVGWCASAWRALGGLAGIPLEELPGIAS